MAIEISFPRGGRKPPPKHAKNVKKRTFNLFKKDKPKDKRTRKPDQAKAVVTDADKNEKITAKSADLLSYRTLPEGMVVLGCVRETKKMAVNINLPGRLSGSAYITQISLPYTKLLQSLVDEGNSTSYKPLQKLFKPGQFVLVKVLKRETTDEKLNVTLSMSPNDVNSELSFKNVFAGMLLWCAVSSVEDHGYAMDTGVSNCRAFLPKTNVDKSKTYAVGELAWCVVQKCETSLGTCTITVSALKKKIETSKVLKDVSLDHLLPGMQVDFTIEEILSNGIQGRFLNDYVGYINEGQLSDVLDKPHKYSVGSTMAARILYTVPIAKLTYLTLKKFEPAQRLLEDGLIVDGQIFSKTRGGFYLKLNKTHRGFVSYNRLKTAIQNVSDKDNDYLKKNYKLGSSHKCRVLGFDHMENLYFCTMEKDMLKEQVFTSKDMKIGQSVTGVITEMQPNGLLVKVGKVNCYVINSHLTDLVLTSYINIKSKYSVGDSIKAKVFLIREKDNSVMLTMKPSLLTENNLLEYSQIEVGMQYQGVISKILEKGIVIQFFGNIQGWLPKAKLSFERIRKPEEHFCIGQVVKCTVLKYDAASKKLMLSLLPPKSVKTIYLGEHMDGTVSRIIDGGLEVQVQDTLMAIVPGQHLTKCPSLASAVLEIYNTGDVLHDLVCIDLNLDVPILSVRESHLTKAIIPDISNVKKDDVLRCSYRYLGKENVILQSPIKNYKGTVAVPKHQFLTDKKGHNLKKNQLVIAKVINKDIKNKLITAKVNYNDLWSHTIYEGVDMLKNYLSEVRRLKQHWNTKNLPIASLDLGNIVEGTVSEIDSDNACFVELTNGETAFINGNHHGKLSVGDKVNGVVLWIDFVNKNAELSLTPSVMTRVNKNQDGDSTHPIGKSIIAQVLLVKPDFVLVTLGPSGNRQLAFLPTYLHPNDFGPDLSCYAIGKKIKVNILEVVNDQIIAVAKDVLKRMKKETAQKVKRKMESDDGGTPAKKKKPNLKNETDSRQTKRKSEWSVEDATDVAEAPGKKKRKRNKKAPKTDAIDTDNQPPIVESMHEAEPIKKMKKRKSKSDADSASGNANEKVEVVLPGVSDFWKASQVQVQEDSSSEEDEDADESAKQQRRKKLTPAERAEEAIAEEERLRQIEVELADSTSMPRSADHFDRVLLATPNDSLLWINYIAFHLEATEIEKARSVARKALTTISFRHDQEKMNVWIALLNLENRYGTKESFNEVLQEAVKMNDDLKIYLQALHILSDSKKSTEFIELLAVVTRKFKHLPGMWIGAAEACHKCEMHDEARNLMHRSMKSLDEKTHVNALVQFALLESKYGEPERAEAIFEKVLSTYVKRVDIWSTYVDMLVKGNRIHIARNILERAVAQKLPARKMKSLYTKFVQFETTHGDESSVKKVRQMAAQYVKTSLQ